MYNSRMTRGPVVFMALILLACAGVFVYTADHAAPQSVGLKPEVSQDANVTEEAYKNRRMDLQTYLNLHIQELSPVQETLGGTFYVTAVSAANGKGVATYEDGHAQYIADFSYTESDTSGYSVTKFRVRDR